MSAQSHFASDFGTWRAQVRKYNAIARINLQNSLAYVWDAMSSGFFIMIFVFIFSQLWSATFDAQGTDTIGGLNLNQTIWYFVWAELVTLSKVNPIVNIQQEVKDGSLAYTLGKPYNYVLYHFFRGLGGVVTRMGMTLVAGSLVAFSQVGLMESFNPLTIPFVLLITMMALILDYCIMASIALLAFFFEDVTAFRLIYSKINFVFGGLLLPIDFLPDGVQSVVRFLPFNLVVYAPSKLWVAWDSGQFVFLLAMQLVWISVLGTVLAIFYRYGAQRVSINGG